MELDPNAGENFRYLPDTLTLCAKHLKSDIQPGVRVVALQTMHDTLDGVGPNAVQKWNPELYKAISRCTTDRAPDVKEAAALCLSVFATCNLPLLRDSLEGVVSLCVKPMDDPSPQVRRAL